MTRARVVFFAILLAAVGLGLALAILPRGPSSPNQPPVNTVPSAQSMRKGDALTFSKANDNAISIADVDAGSSDIKVTLVVTNGALNLSRADAAVSGNGTANVTIVGSLANINAALDNLVFRPAADFNGHAHLTVATSDLGNTGSGGALGDTDTIDIAVNAPVEVMIANARNKQLWFTELAKSFQAEGRKTSVGSTITITSQPVESGKSMEDILKDKLKPVVWSPGTQSWVEEFDEQWKQENGGQSLMGAECKPTIIAPLGIAMWRPMAEALGWPNKPISWKTIVELAAAPGGWSAFGHPEWGSFNLGYPHAVYSNVGMLFMTALVYGIGGKAENL